MTDFPHVGLPQALLLKHLLDRPLTCAPQERIVYRDLKELTYEGFWKRVRQLGRMLVGLGVQPGDRVGVMDWDSHRYLELFFAVPMLGAVLHTINMRLSPEQLAYTIAHGGDKVLLVHTDFVPLLEPLAPRLTSIRTMVQLADDGKARPTTLTFAGEYEALLAACEAEFEFGDFDENVVATLFYTTGTTGEPKGVFFTHRQLVLHTLCSGLLLTSERKPFGLSSEAVYMPLTPMFHVHAWGVPYIATLLGMKQVYPGRYEPHMLLRLLTEHRVTFSHCVPSILQTLLHHPDSHSFDLSALNIVIGGAALAPALARQAMDRGIRIMGGYGMSETCPIVATAHVKAAQMPANRDEELGIVTKTGMAAPLVRAAVVDNEGKFLPPGKAHVGELVLQSPWLTTGYFKNGEKSRELWRGGWLHTGDVAYMDEEGYIRITDRLKDVIKIGGEWISSLELESALGQHEAVKDVAVIGIPDSKWDECPCAQVVLRDEFRGKVTPKQLARFLHGFIDRGQIHKRAILTQITIVDALPRTSVGKLDKKSIRSQRLGVS